MVEETQNTEVVEEVEQENVTAEQETEQTEQQPQEETFTKAEMEEIIAKRVSREKKAAEKAVQEAEKLAKMNQEEKERYEYEKLKQELDEYKRKDTFYSLSKEASNMLSEHGVQANDELLQFVVKEDAEGTQQAVNSFIGLFNKAVEAQVKEKLSGKAPRVNTGTGTGWTKEKIMQVTDTAKRQKLIADNLELFP